MSIQKGIVVIAAFLIGVAIGFLVSWAVGLADGAQIQVLDGYAWVNEEGTAIALSPDGETPGAGYVVAGALWREQSDPWHDTFLPALSCSQAIKGYGWVFWMLAPGRSPWQASRRLVGVSRITDAV